MHIRQGPNKTSVGDCAVVQKVVCVAVLELAGHDDSIRRLQGYLLFGVFIVSIFL